MFQCLFAVFFTWWFKAWISIFFLFSHRMCTSFQPVSRLSSCSLSDCCWRSDSSWIHLGPLSISCLKSGSRLSISSYDWKEVNSSLHRNTDYFTPQFIAVVWLWPFYIGDFTKKGFIPRGRQNTLNFTSYDVKLLYQHYLRFTNKFQPTVIISILPYASQLIFML